MTAQRAVKANHKVVNQRLLHARSSRWHRKCHIWFQTRHFSSPREVLGGLAPLTKLQQYQLVELLSNFQNTKSPRKAHCWWLSVDGSGPVICTFPSTKNRRLSNNDFGLSLHTMRLCQNLLPKEKQCLKFRNDWAICSKRTKFSGKKVLLFSFHDINTKPKKASLLRSPWWIKKQSNVSKRNFALEEQNTDDSVKCFSNLIADLLNREVSMFHSHCSTYKF